MQRLRIVTTSWDDGDASDIRIADLLRSRGIAGTFYVPITGYSGKKRLSDCDLRTLCSEGLEIGAHTVSHKTLSRLMPKELHYEVGTCKQILEQTLGREVLMFCYPNGRYTAEATRCVKDAGYLGARTVRMLCQGAQFPAFEMPTTIQAYPHPAFTYIKNQGRAKSISGLMKYVTEYKRFGRWVDLGKHLFDEVLENGGIWHMYGHSWEIDELGIWNDLRELLDYVSYQEGVTYATNGGVLRLLHQSAAAKLDEAVY